MECLTRLSVDLIQAGSVLNKNSLRKYSVIEDKQLQKKERGHFEQCSAHQARRLCNLCGCLELQEDALHNFFWILPT